MYTVGTLFLKTFDLPPCCCAHVLSEPELQEPHAQQQHVGIPQPGIDDQQHGPGHGVVRGFREDLSAYMLDIEGAIMELGVWWLDAAQRGQLDTLPIVNMEPIMETQ